MDAIDKRIGCWSAVGVVWFLALAWTPYSRYEPDYEGSVTHYAFLNPSHNLLQEGWGRDWSLIVAEGVVGTLVLCNGFAGLRIDASRVQRIATRISIAFNLLYMAFCVISGFMRFNPVVPVYLLGIVSFFQWISLGILVGIQSFRTQTSKNQDPHRQHL